MNYDYVIVGGGPCGLTLATYLSKMNKKICLVEKENSLGGCNRVLRVNGLFSEHGPRVYSGAYLNFMSVLKDINLNFFNLFTPYYFNILSTTKGEITSFKIVEILIITLYFLTLNEKYKLLTMDKFMEKHSFSKKTKNNLDLMCRLTCGAGSDKTTIYKFLKLIDNNIFYKFYQPKKPLDISLFNYWEQYLTLKNVNIIKGVTVEQLYTNNNIIYSVKLSNNKIIIGDNVILSLPPYSISKILSNNLETIDAFGPFEKFNKWVNDTNYITYIPIIFHWDSKILNNGYSISSKWGKPQGDWGIYHIVLSNYMDFNDDRSTLVISTAITRTDAKSEFTKKTANQTSDKKELIDEVFRQIKLIHKDLPNPSYSILNQNYYDETNLKWIPNDTSFVETISGTMDFKSIKYKNLYMCGTQNGKSNFEITTMETAITNALALANTLEPYLKININSPSMLSTYIKGFYAIMFVGILKYFIN
jgi:hypothetical protein